MSNFISESIIFVSKSGREIFVLRNEHCADLKDQEEENVREQVELYENELLEQEAQLRWTQHF